MAARRRESFTSGYSVAGCWEVFERKGVEPFYLEKAQAVYYAQQRGRLGNATVRIYDEQGQVEREIAPPKEEQMLYAPRVRSS